MNRQFDKGMKPRRSGRKGFALVVVIWGIGVISLLAISFMSTARMRLQESFNVTGAVKASLIAEAAINLTILSLLSEQSTTLVAVQSVLSDGQTPSARAVGATERPRRIRDGRPRQCAFADGVVAVAIEDEGGKVDLNGASQKLLQTMLAGYGVEMQRADALANAIVAFRSAPTNDVKAKEANYETVSRPFGPKKAPFQTVLELDQVAGVEPSMLKEILPVVTVHSRHPGVDPQTAPPALYAALSGFSESEVRALSKAPFPNALDRNDPRFPTAFKQTGESGVFLIHVEAFVLTAQTSVQDVIVDLRPSSTPGSLPSSGEVFTIRELRQGAKRHIEQLRAAVEHNATHLPNCLD